MDVLGIKIKTILDANTKDINAQINQLSTKIDKLKVKVALDTTDLQNINQVMQDIKKLMSVNSKKYKVFDGEQIKKDGIEVFTTLEQIENKYKNLGRITFPNKILDPVTKELTGLTVQVEKADGVVEKFKYNLINISNGSNLTKGFTLQNITQSDKTASIQEKQLQETQKINQKIQQENQKISKQKMDLLHAEALEMNKVYDASVKAFSQAEQRKRNEAQKTSQQQAQLNNKTLQENYNKMLNEAYSMNRAFDAERQRVFNLGTNLTSKTSGFTGVDQTSVSKYAKEIYGVNATVVKFNQTMNRNGQIMSEATVRVEKSANEYIQYRMKIDETTKSVNQFGDAVNRKTGKDMSFFEKFKTALEIFPVWLGATTIIMQSINSIKSGIQYIVDMDNAMVELGKVTEFTSYQMNELRISAINMGKELGKSSVDVMKAYSEIARVYKDPEDIKELSKVAVMASNVTSLSALDASKAINTMMLTYKLGVKDASSLLDKLNEIQNNYRTSAEDLASSVGKVGAAAKQAGIPINDLLGYTTALVSSTGITGDESGTAIKSIISRMYRIGPEGEEDAGKSEETLVKLGIAVRNNVGEFRAFGDILTDIKKSWGDWSNITKQNVSQVIAGTYHYSKFINLIENLDIATNASKTALTSQNSALKENEKYLNSISGRTQIFKATIQGKWGSLIEADWIKNLISSLTELIDTFGNFKTVLTIAGTALLIWKGSTLTSVIKNMKGFSLATKLASTDMVRYQATLAGMTAEEIASMSATNGLKFAFIGLGQSIKVAFLSNPIGMIALGITALVSAVDIFNQKQEEMKQKIEESADAAKEQSNSIIELYSKYNDLTSLQVKDESARQELKNVQEQIVKLLGLEKEGIDLVNDSRGESIKKIREESLEKLKSNEQNLKAAYNIAKNAADKTKGASSSFGTSRDFYSLIPDKEEKKAYDLLQKSSIKGLDFSSSGLSVGYRQINAVSSNIEGRIKIIQEAIEYLDKLNQTDNDVYTQLVASKSKYQTALDKENSALEELNKNLAIQGALMAQMKVGTPTDKNFDKFKESAVEAIAKQEGLNKVSEDFKKIIYEQINNLYPQLSKKSSDVQETTITQSKTFEDLSKDVKTTVTEIKELNDIQSDLAKENTLTADSLIDLINKYPELLDYIKKTSDGYIVETKGLELVKQALIDKQKVALETECGITDIIKTELKDRLKIYGLEIEGITTLSQAREAALKMTGQINSPSKVQEYKELTDQLEALAKINALKDMLESGLTIPKVNTKEKTPKEKSEIITQDLTKEFIDAYNAQAEITENQAESLERQIKIADSAKDYNKELKLTNQLIDTRNRKINDLLTANRKINAEANKLRGSSGYDTTKWFNSNGNATTTYLSLLKSFEGKSSESAKKQLDNIKKLFDNLQALKQAYLGNNDEITKQLDLIDEQKQKIIELNKAQQEAIQKQNEDKLKLFEDVENQIIDLLKKSHEKEKDILDEALDNYKEYTDDKIKEIERYYDALDYEEEVADKSKEILDLQAEKDKYKMADDTASKARVAEIDKELADKQKDLAKTQRDNEKKMRKENLDDQLNKFEKFINEKKDIEDKALEESSLKLEAESILMKNNLQDVQNSIINLFNVTGENASKAGLIVQNELISKLAQAVEIYKQLEIISGKVGGDNPLGMSKSDFTTYVANKKSWTEGNATKTQIQQNADLRKKYGISTDEYTYEQLKGYETGGVNTKPGFYMLHGTETNPELILNAMQTRKLFNTINNPSGNLTKVNNNNSVTHGDIHITMPIHVNGNLDKSVLPDIDNMVGNSLKRILNRQGVMRRV